jgi:hypothetical protein
MKLLCGIFKEKFSIDTGLWVERGVDFQEQWERLNPWQKKLVIPIIDAIRHIMDASPHNLKPLDREGVIIFASPQEFCREDMFTHWIETLDRLFPNIQFIITSHNELIEKIPGHVLAKGLKVPRHEENKMPSSFPILGRLKEDTVLLIDVDGRIPNPALMKLSTFIKKQGKNVVLAHYDKWCAVNLDAIVEVYASCIFNFSHSLRRTERLRERFGTNLILGGSGVEGKN